MADDNRKSKPPTKSKAELYEMLAQAVRNTAPELNPSQDDEKKGKRRVPSRLR